MVYLLHGFIGSGKTTRAKELEAQLNALRINADDWMSALFGYDPPAENFQQNLDTILNLLQPLWIKAAQAGVPVILDYGFWTKQFRNETESLLMTNNIPYKWVIIATPLEECRRRNQLRNQNAQGALNITDATFDALSKRFEPM